MLEASNVITDFHSRYFALELTRRRSSDSVEKLTAALADAQVDLNPHQVEAALFAFKNPLSLGAILADEVGLGKTIEAGLLLAQKWAERRRRLLVIVPANLRKQWSQELADKFFLPSVIMESRSFNAAISAGNLNPLQQDAILICSYHFARAKAPYIRQTNWELVVIDEAHRLRNVYKPSSKIANAIKEAIAPYRKILLTATPLQNSILELYGLVSILDDYTFGDLGTFRARYSRLTDEEDFQDLKDRLLPVCKRTLRKQVLEYVKYTTRLALVQEFVPSVEEQKLYELVSDYLQRDNLYALPSGQRQLMTLILRKLLASSTYAISGTLAGLAAKLESAAAEAQPVQEQPEGLEENWESLEELADEWEEEDAPTDGERPRLTPEQLVELREEMALLKEFHLLARSIAKNSKGEVLLTALRRGFNAASDAQKALGSTTLHQKAVIFTESRRTQEYLFRILEETEFKGKVVMFNGQNNDLRSKEIYQRWVEKNKGTDRISSSPSADMRAALVEAFRDEAAILIATEAAAEGINLQFCNLVVNYDLPWNPQRIEQRIGRCHRYGQKFDVVVVNFLNKNNAADQRVYQLLDEKFRLFNGVFGASDEVLGAVESGVDFEKRIAGIYHKCRTVQQIQLEFDFLQKELEVDIDAGKRDAREKLLNNFDHEVVEKVRIETRDSLNVFEERLWLLTQRILGPYARFDILRHSFLLESIPGGLSVHAGPYRMEKNVNDANTYRIGHPLAGFVIERARMLGSGQGAVRFDLAKSGKRIAALEGLAGQNGWLSLILLTVTALETEEYLLLAGLTDAGVELDLQQCRRLFDLPGEALPAFQFPTVVATSLTKIIETQTNEILGELSSRDGNWFDTEMEKLDRWADDRRLALKAQLQEMDTRIKDTKKEARLAPNLPKKLELERKLRNLGSERDQAWKAYDGAAIEVEKEKDGLLDRVSQRLKQDTKSETVFTIRWELV